LPESDIDLLFRAAREAGDIACRFWKSAPENWDKGGGAGPVSEADLAVNAHLRRMLAAARPDYGWLSEESEDDKTRLRCERVFIIDPIDGTRAFIAGEETWAHSLAIARDGRIETAVVHLPVRNRTYSAVRGAGAFVNGRAMRASACSTVAQATILAARASFDPVHWKGGSLPASRAFRPSLAYRLALVGEGRFDAMLTLRDTWEWDVAAGTLIVQEAGATVTDRRGAAPVFNNPHPALAGLVAAPAGLHGALLARLS